MLSENRSGLSTRVAIIGRPNVGKSTLFNYLTESRKAVVKNQPGVTRDIIIEPAEIWGHQFDVIDTGGLTEAPDLISKLIREQVVEFLSSVDLLLVVMDGRHGLIPEDRDIIRIANETGRPYLVVINKVDSVVDHETAKTDFYELGVDLITASFERRFGMDKVLEWIVEHIPREISTMREGMTLAIVGKPNVGKSSMVNQILGEHRMLVSNVAGTTVDSVDTEFVYKNKKYILVDTAGLRRSARRTEGIEIISAFKSHDAIGRADLVLLMIDANEGPSEQDAKILEAILETHRAVVVVANKVDIAEAEMDDYKAWFKEKISREFHFFADIPIVFTSAKTGRGVRELFQKIEDIHEKLMLKIPTGELNDFFTNVIRLAPAPVYGTTNVKFYYLTQTKQVPPAFIAFANQPDGVTPSYRRFLAKKIQEHWGLEGIPVRIFVMKSGGRQL